MSAQKNKFDILTELGPLGFASRLKRLSERLMRDVSRIYSALDVHFEARWFGVVYALTLHKKLSVTELADSLGLTHPAINQVAAELTRAGLIESSKDSADDRRRLLLLTPKGRNTAKALEPVWEVIREATNELLAETKSDSLEDLSAIESALDNVNMYERVRQKLKEPLNEKIEINPYRPAYKKNFERLNREWLEEFFSVEPHDERVISDPNGQIIRRGGQIFFAVVNNDVVGCAALIKHKHNSGDTFELAKMAVTNSSQGRGIGRKLAEEVIQLAKKAGARELYLQTSPSLERANRLYKSLGFRESKENPFDVDWKRCTSVQKLQLR